MKNLSILAALALVFFGAETQAIPPPPPTQRPYTLITYEQPNWQGYYQVVNGWGCQPLSGAAVSSFQGRHDYRFHIAKDCSDQYVYEGDESEESIPTIYP
ncbi:hypothetical protein BGZ73_005946, partial [Actinomortierella ambigua]